MASPADYRHLNANQTPWQRLISFYEANAQDQTNIIYTFPRSQMSIEIPVHKQIPLLQFKQLLRKFYIAKATEDRVGTEDLEIRIRKRGQRGAELSGMEEGEVVQDDETEVDEGEGR
jgi:hypothetical protein